MQWGNFELAKKCNILFFSFLSFLNEFLYSTLLIYKLYSQKTQKWLSIWSARGLRIMYCQALLLLFILMVFMVSRPLLWLVAAGQVAVIIIARLTHILKVCYKPSFLGEFGCTWPGGEGRERVWEGHVVQPGDRLRWPHGGRAQEEGVFVYLSVCPSFYLSIL